MSPLVVNGRIAGFAWEPGRNAGYRAGRSLRQGGCCHQTAGSCAGDRSILTNLGGAYVPRDPGCGPGATQFSEIDAVAFTQCEFNDELMACEVEWVPGQDFTAYQIDMCGRFVAACIELGVPDRRVDPADRVPVGTNVGGFIDHRKLVHRACGMHADGWYAHWPEIHAAALRHLGAGAPAPIIGEPMNGIARTVTVVGGKTFRNFFWIGDDGKARQDAHVSGSGPGTGWIFRSKVIFPNTTFRPNADADAYSEGQTVVFAAITEANDRFQRNYTYGTPDWVPG